MTTVEKEQFWTQIVENPSLWGTIQTNDKNFNAQAENIWTVMNETFVINGSLKEVNRWEIMLGDRLVGSGEGTLEERKIRILKQITEHPPITIGLLEQLIKETTDNNYVLIFDKQTSSLIIECFEKDYNSIVSFIPSVIPTVLNVEYIFNELPAGYLQVEFLENVTLDSAYLSLGVEYFESLEIDITPTSLGTRDFFAWAAQAGKYRQGLETYNGYYAVCYGRDYSRERRSSVAAVAGERVKLLMDSVNKTLSINGTLCSTVDLFAIATVSALKLKVPDSAYLRLHGLTFTTDGVTANLIPTLDKGGQPCMLDLVSKQTFRNAGTGQFIAGFTLEQARKLGKLSDSGGALTVSLPTGYESDAAVMTALETARSKGWTLTIQTYENASTTSTYSMRRIWVRKTEDENGNYVDSDGNRFIVEWCVDILSPENKSPENYGYESFRNKESAIEYWGLTEWIDPEMEKLTEEQN